MILYSASKQEFCQDIVANRVETKLLEVFDKKLGRKVAAAEMNSWNNSLNFMHNLVNDREIPDDAHIALEYRIPRSAFRIDFVISGFDELRQPNVVIVELKQWTEIGLTDQDAIVTTRFQGKETKTNHPSYQAWSYAAMLADFSSVVQDEKISLKPCAYLHNCKDGSVIRHPFYQEHIDRAPVFLREDAIKLQQFIKRHVKYGDKDGILYKIDHGKIRPSKSLADQILSMLKGNQEFLMIDDQKVVLETALSLAKSSNARNRNVLIVNGGPGSGKTVVAINLLVKMTELGFTSQYVTKNAAPRAVYEQKLTGSFKKSQISNMFVGSGSFTESDKNEFDTLIVDEAHRLNAKSGLYGNLGENQIKEIINAASFSVFFLDESQRVTFKDIGSREEIFKWAAKSGAQVTEMELTSQFRCSGSDAYLSWLDDVLQVRPTANPDLARTDYDFQVFDRPEDLYAEILKRNQGNKARLVAGYCWPWNSKKNPRAYDIELGDNFRIRWNLTSDGSAWIIQPNSVEQAGCIHTCQGLEVEYIGVIIGPDLVVRDGIVITDGLKRAQADQSIKGFKSMLKKNRTETLAMADSIIKNTYRTLMTRGMKGCYIHSTDPETNQYFRSRMEVLGETDRSA